jgi:hypothetical protein
LSIEAELNGKGGRVCEQARRGEIHCPLIVRPTSEDVLTGNVFGMLKHLRPHLWLNPMLNLALDGDANSGRFRQVWFKDLKVKFWERQARFPPELLDFKEGSTEPDVIIEWENPPTTVWIEAKYHSGFAKGTNDNDDNDQVIRGVRTLLADTGHIQPARLFSISKRRPVWLALLSYKPEPLVDHYRDEVVLLHAIPDGEAIVTLPEQPFLGTLTWSDIGGVLHRRLESMTGMEQSVSQSLIAYLDHKRSTP